MKDKENLIEMETRSYPLSYNENNNSVQVVFSTGERVLRSTATRAQYWEDLEISNSAIDFSRLNSGAPVLKNHDQSFDSVIGVVERGYIENGEAIASIKFSSREDVKPIIQDIKDGVLRNISVGYRIEKAEKIVEKDSNIPVMRAVRWVPFELSICPMGADSKAHIRNLTQEEQEMILDDVKGTIEGVDSETKETVSVAFDTAKTDAAPDTTTETPVRAVDTVLLERNRIKDIIFLTRQANLSNDLADELIGSGATVSQARSQILDKIISNQPTIKNTTTVVDSKENFHRGMEEAIEIRSGLIKDDGKNEFKGYTLGEMAKRALELNGVSTSGSKLDIIGRAFTSTSDYPEILSNVANKSLKKGYEEQATTWEQWASVVSVPDFKPATFVALSEFGLLNQMGELEEYKYGTVSEGKETVQIGTFGKMFAISRTAIVNDDTGAFTRIPQAMGQAAKRTVNKTAYDRLFASTAMADGKAVFHTDHANIGTGVLSVANLDAGRIIMMKQKDIANSAFLNISPSILLCPVAIGGTARILMSAQFDPIVTNKFQVPNDVSGMATVVTDPLLDANSTAIWYLISKQYESFVVGFLDGNTTPYTEVKQGWSVDGVEMKIRLDWGLGCIDHRPVFRSTGA